MSTVSQVSPAPSRFRYQVTLLSAPEADRTSISPSPSMSAARTSHAPEAIVEMTCSVHKSPDPVKFSYQAILLSKLEAERASMSPSRSRSTAMTLTAPSAEAEMTCCAPKVPAPSRFGYQAILSSLTEAERASISPSPSTSAATTDRAPSADVVITCCAPKVPPPSKFEYQ